MKEKDEKSCLVPTLLESYAQAKDKDMLLCSLDTQIRSLQICQQVDKASCKIKIGARQWRRG
jgi:hypothetical protein